MRPRHRPGALRRDWQGNLDGCGLVVWRGREPGGRVCLWLVERLRAEQCLGYPVEASEDSCFVGSASGHAAGLAAPGELVLREVPAGTYLVRLFGDETDPTVWSAVPGTPALAAW